MTLNNNRIIKSSYSFTDKFVLAISNFFRVAFLFTIIISLIYCLWIGWAFSEKLRELLHNPFWSILVYIASIALVFIYGLFVPKLGHPFVLGRPAFGELGGWPFHTFSAAIRAAAQINVELFERDRSLTNRYNFIQNRILHDLLQAKYEKMFRKGSPADAVNETWTEVWDQQILDMKLGEQTLRETMDVNKFGLNLAISTLSRATTVIPLLTILFWIVIVFFIYLYANQQIELLTCLRVGTVLALVFAAFWYIFVLHNFSIVSLTFKGQEINDLTRKEFEDEMRTLEGEEIRPKVIQLKKRFFSIVRNYQLRLLTSSVLSDSSILLLLLIASYGVTLLVDADYANSIRSYHELIGIGILVAAFSLIFSFYVFSVVLQNFRKISAVLLATLLSAGLPFLMDYLIRGHIDMSSVRDAILVGSGGLTVALVTAIASNVKESMQ